MAACTRYSLTKHTHQQCSATGSDRPGVTVSRSGVRKKKKKSPQDAASRATRAAAAWSKRREIAREAAFLPPLGLKEGVRPEFVIFGRHLSSAVLAAASFACGRGGNLRRRRENSGPQRAWGRGQNNSDIMSITSFLLISKFLLCQELSPTTETRQSLRKKKSLPSPPAFFFLLPPLSPSRSPSLFSLLAH